MGKGRIGIISSCMVYGNISLIVIKREGWGIN